MLRICDGCTKETDHSVRPIPDACYHRYTGSPHACVGDGALPGVTFTICEGCQNHYNRCGKCREFLGEIPSPA